MYISGNIRNNRIFRKALLIGDLLFALILSGSLVSCYSKKQVNGIIEQAINDLDKPTVYPSNIFDQINFQEIIVSHSSFRMDFVNFVTQNSEEVTYQINIYKRQQDNLRVVAQILVRSNDLILSTTDPNENVYFTKLDLPEINDLNSKIMDLYENGIILLDYHDFPTNSEIIMTLIDFMKNDAMIGFVSSDSQSDDIFSKFAYAIIPIIEQSEWTEIQFRE